MKISGPKGSSPIKPTDAEPLAKTKRAGASEFERVLTAESRQAQQQAAGPQAAGAARFAPQIQAVIGRLRAGEISSTQASQALVDAVVHARGATLSPDARQQLGQALSRMLSDDPVLAGQLRQLTGSGSEE